ncbi:uncharacterized protein LOC8281656 [Ricinus communis]|uniref:uncharacterized protein LOC8281656 n=1 Tax=Ricinus communis TaxID=3988 RepID=UPI00201AC1FB|nr:uncharacterized protein LOC8281656 [Ricinus communis]
MATANVDSSAFAFNCLPDKDVSQLQMESLPLIDLRLLSQSELLSLSLCSFSFLNNPLQNEADVATLKIDRSVFNESAGSRKQTFSRLRLARRNNNNSHFSTPSIRNQIPHQTVEISQDEENSQIIYLIKSLFGSNFENEKENNEVDNVNLFSDDNLISVPITYNESFQALQDLAVADYSDETKQAIATAITHSESTAEKRKRGRPRKNLSDFVGNNNVDGNDNGNEKEEKEETAITDSKRKRGRPQKDASTLGCHNNNNVNANEEKRAVCENPRTQEEEKRGMKVELGSSEEDPYAEELRRRTMGMQTESELLGFLEGLQGEWMSKRKKRKIVDASVLGDVLPRNWKLILCNKRRAGFFWLDCTGYISPNGQQFMSCKEVSSNLLSKELQGVSQSSFGHDDSNIQLTGTVSYGNAADLTLKNNKNGGGFISSPALPVTKSVEHEKQATTLAAVVPPHVQTVEKYNCHKCTMAFQEPDDLLQHLLSSHQRAPKRLRQGTSTNEELIIKNGKYECQFCPKMFEERHRFNGHLGNHIKDYFKRIEASGGVMKIQRSTVPPSVAIHSDVLEMQGSNRLDFGSVAMHSVIKTNDEISTSIPGCEIKENSIVDSYCGKQDIVDSMTNEKEKKTNEATNTVTVENNIFSGDESLLSNTLCKSPNETTFLQCIANRIDNIHSQEEGSQNSSLAAFRRDQICAADINKDQVIMSSIDEHNQERDLDGGLLALNSEGRAFGGENIKDRPLFSTITGMKLDETDFAGKDKLSTDFGEYCPSQGDPAANIKEQRSSEGYSFVLCGNGQRYCSVNNLDELSTSNTAELTHARGSKGPSPSSLDAKTCPWNNKVNQVSTSTVTRSRCGELGKSRTNVQTVNFGNNKTLTIGGTVTSCEPESSLGRCSVIPSWNEQTCFAENDKNATRRCTRKKNWQEKGSEGSQLTLFSGEQSLGFENNIMKVFNYTSGLTNHEEVQDSKNSDCSKDADLVVGHVTNIELERSANSFLLDPSGNHLMFAAKDEFLNGSSKNLAQGRISESSSHRQSCDEQKGNNENNMISFITMDQHKNKEVKSREGEPHLVFHHRHVEHDADIVKNTMEKDSFLSISGNKQKFAAEDNRSGIYRSTQDEQRRASIESLFCLSSSEQVLGVENNSDMVLTGKVQQKPRLEELYPRKNESAIGFSTDSQASENAASEFMWRTDEENDLLSSFADTSSQLVQSSGCFPTYGAMSEKGESELFGHKFSGISGFEGLKSGNMENMEYNFMTSHSDESKIFPYGVDIAQGLEPSVWLEKEAMPLLPKMTSKRHIRTFCVWCRNEFQYEALESEAQIGSLGLTCAACKAKFSGQFNLL